MVSYNNELIDAYIINFPIDQSNGLLSYPAVIRLQSGDWAMRAIICYRAIGFK